jgi:hypothetical protein
MRRAVVVAVLLACAGPAPALAAWGPPVRLARGVAEPHMALADDGTTIAVWRSGRSIRAALRPPGGTFGAAVTLVRGRFSSVRLSAAPSGAAVALWRDRRRLFASVRPAGGSFGAPRRLVTARRVTLPDVKVAASGAAVAVWQEQLRSGAVRVRAARLAAGGRRFGTPFRVASPGAEPRLAVDAAGNGLVAYLASLRRLDVRHLPAGGGLGTLQAVQTRTRAYRVAVGPAGHALLAWATFNDGLDALHVMYGLPNAPLGARETLERDLGRLRFGTGIDAQGNATLLWIWLERRTINYQLRTATRTPALGFGPYALIASGYLDHARLAVNPRGDAIAAWWASVAEDFRHLAAARPAGATAFSAPVVLGGAAEGNDFAPDIALSGTGRAIAVWLTNPVRTRRGFGDFFFAEYVPE